ncbi:uncharacterized protein LOC135121407 isoform X2 [Zophobas morio]|jgi:hypothetical protein|uniref:uncharacterized protein LOC135121407 isoform X2 n=1 Tax=Zophobas morio TaxID=2755281 RepID=UPI0030835382
MPLYNAPVCTGLALVISVTSLYSNFPPPSVTNSLKNWPILFAKSTICCSSPLFLVLYLLLLNTFASLERAYGSRKFSSFLTVSVTVDALLKCLSFITLKIPCGSWPQGPFFALFSCFYLYARHIPARNFIKIYSKYTNEKIIPFSLCLFLFSCSFPFGLINGFAGLLFGYIYYSNFGKIAEFRLPKLIANIFSTFLTFLSFSPSEKENKNEQVQETLPDDTANENLLNTEPRDTGEPHTKLSAPSEELIEKLVLMGFKREAAIEALEDSNSNLERAINFLLD